jgi:outer membrane protein assembly factor BamB
MNSHKFQKALVAIASVWLLVARTHALEFAPPKAVYDSQEVLWFSATDSNLITVSGNGSVGVWNFSSGAMLNQFSLSTNELAYPVNNLSASRHRQLALAMLTDQATLVGDKFFSTVTGYDASGKRVNNFKVEIVSPSICGFVETTSTLILADSPPNNAVVMAMDTSSGKTLWRSETDDDVQTGTIALADGQCYVNFCRDRHLRARNQSDKLVWDWPVPKGKFAEPGYWPDTPDLPYVVVFESDEETDNIADLVALSAKNGKELWRKKNAQFGSLKAISDDGKHQAFFQEGCVEIASLPEQTKPNAIALKDDVDAVFSPDGRFLFCLPSLVKVSEDKAQNIETFARHSRLLSVVDVETGKIVKEFSLATPVEKH